MLQLSTHHQCALCHKLPWLDTSALVSGPSVWISVPKCLGAEESGHFSTDASAMVLSAEVSRVRTVLGPKFHKPVVGILLVPKWTCKTGSFSHCCII